MRPFVVLLAGAAVAVGVFCVAHRLLAALCRREKAGAIHRIRAALIAVCALGLLAAVYGFLIEPRWVEVTHVRVPSRKLTCEARPIRLVHISDLHCDPTPRLEEKLPEIIAGEHPDLIVFSGDAINSPEALEIFKTCMRRLAAIAPTFAVKGNWDVHYFRDVNRFRGTGVQELDGTAVKLTFGGTELWIAGAAAGSRRSMRRVLKVIPEDAFSIFVYHYPGAVYRAASRGVDLYLAGHTHGGQVALPFLGALVTLSRFGRRFERGLYRVGGTTMYVNRGIGMEGGPVPRVRLFAWPEVTVIDIVPRPCPP